MPARPPPCPPASTPVHALYLQLTAFSGCTIKAPHRILRHGLPGVYNEVAGVGRLVRMLNQTPKLKHGRQVCGASCPRPLSSSSTSLPSKWTSLPVHNPTYCLFCVSAISSPLGSSYRCVWPACTSTSPSRRRRLARPLYLLCWPAMLSNPC